MKAENVITGNEPAFPDPSRGAEQNYYLQDPQAQPQGITIRQHFAAMAMQGLCVQAIPDRTNGNTKEFNDFRAEHAVAMADALIEALNGKP